MREGIGVIEPAHVSNIIQLDKLYNEHEAAQILMISLPLLRRARREGRIAYLKFSERRVAYRGRHIQDFLDASEVQCRGSKAKSGTSGSRSVKGDRRGTGRGTIQDLDRHDASRLALETFGKPSRS